MPPVRKSIGTSNNSKRIAGVGATPTLAQASSSTYKVRKTTQDEYLTMKRIEEARAKGQIIHEGHEANPYIPFFISKTPWYTKEAFETEGVGEVSGDLLHQRRLEDYLSRLKEGEGEREERLPSAQRMKIIFGQAKKYRKGACENCGSGTHKTKDCLERPRAVGARWTNKDIQPDEVLVDQRGEKFEAKRDRWATYNPDDYKEFINLKQQELEQQQQEEEDDDSDDDPEKLLMNILNEHHNSDGNASLDTRTTVMNLRIREDTAKYLHNLDPESAFYDPKTRLMLDNPYESKKVSNSGLSLENSNNNNNSSGLDNLATEPGSTTLGTTSLPFEGDREWRQGGMVKDIPKMQLFAWQQAERFRESDQRQQQEKSICNLQATPTAAALHFEQHKRALIQKQKEEMSKLEALYGPLAETAPTPPTTRNE